jgi:murein DD-endopeptidase MepM/ murein hydrolase activator NlpD
VLFAGSDAETTVGPRTNFYGNVVIIQHPLNAPEGGGLFTLYGHMSKIEVQGGQTVAQGDRIGLVGATGVALGSHLHFEVRVGDPFSYFAVRNPELWYPPLPGRARLIGRVLNADGSPAPGVRVTLTTASAVLATFSYEDPALPSDPTYNENFVIGDLRAGCYRLRVRGAVGYAYDEPLCFARNETKLVEIRLP